MKSDEELYEIAAKELFESPRKGLLIKCMAKSCGDEQKGKAFYIKKRVAELKSESNEIKFQGFRLKLQNGFHILRNVAKLFSQKCFPSKSVTSVLLVSSCLLSYWVLDKSEPHEIYYESYFYHFPNVLGFWLGIFLGLFIPACLICLLSRFLSKGKIHFEKSMYVFFLVAIFLCGYGLNKDGFRFSKEVQIEMAVPRFRFYSVPTPKIQKPEYKYTLSKSYISYYSSQFAEYYRKLLEEQNHPYKDLDDVELTQAIYRKMQRDGLRLSDMPEDFQVSVSRINNRTPNEYKGDSALSVGMQEFGKGLQSGWKTTLGGYKAMVENF